MRRLKKPTPLKVIEGTFKKSDANPREPQAPRGIATPPPSLTPEQRAAYLMFAKQLRAIRVDSEVDVVNLASLAVCYVEVQDLRAFIQKHGRTYTTVTPQGSKIRRPFPEVGMLDREEKRLRLLLGDFGLFPAARPNIDARPDDPRPGDPDEEFTAPRPRGRA